MNTDELAIIRLASRIADMQERIEMGRQYYDGLEQRVAEISEIDCRSPQAT